MIDKRVESKCVKSPVFFNNVKSECTPKLF